MWHGDGFPLYQLALSDHQTMLAAGPSGITRWNLAGRRTAIATRLFDNDFTPLLAARPGTSEMAIANLTGIGDITYPMQLWNPQQQGQIGQDISGLTGRASSLAWSADGRWLAAGQQQGDVLVWDVDHRGRPPSHIARRRAVDVAGRPASPVMFPAVVSAGSNRFAIIERSGDAEVRSPGTARPVRTFSVGAGAAVAAVASDPTGTRLAVGYATGTVTLSSLLDGRPLRTLAGHSRAVGGITFSADGRLIASLGDDGAVNVTDLEANRVLGRLTAHAGPVTAAVFTTDSKQLYTSSTDGTVIGWDIANLNNLGSQLSPPGGEPLQWMATSRTGDIAVGYPNGTLRFWGSASVTPSRPIHVSDRPLIAGAFSPDGRLLATSDLRGRAELVDVRGQHVIGMAQLPDPVWAVAFSPDGRRTVWIDDVGRVYYFDPLMRTQIGPTQAFLPNVRRLVWSPDSQNIAATRLPPPEDDKSDDRAGGPVAVFNTSTNREQWSSSSLTQSGSDSTFQGVAWSPDGTTIAAGGDADTGVLLLRASDGTRVGGGWRDHAETSTVAYSPDGSTIASTGSDGTVVLRDVPTSDRVGPPLVASYNQQPSLASFDAAGHLIVATLDGGLWRWNIDLPYLLRQACAIAGRNLTTREWADLHTAHPYLTACA